MAVPLSQEALAERIGMHRNYIGLVERGEADVTAKTLFAIGAVLGVSPALFFDPRTDVPAPVAKRRGRSPASPSDPEGGPG